MHMQDDFPLLLSTLYDNAVWQYPQQEIVSVEADRSIHRTTYAETDVRVRKLATALAQLGIDVGARVGTFAWNNHRHHELYWATVNTGRVCHTLNIRLFADQLTYIVNHAEDKVIFIDPDLAPLVAPLVPSFTTVEHFVILGDSTEGCGIDGAIAYEDLIAGAEPQKEWPLLDEASPMMFCYTSGTTGNPKGVAYTQRSTYLHTISNLAMNPISAVDNVLPVVPMFHAAAWGYPFMAVTVGAKMTYPGPDLSGKALVDLFVNERPKWRQLLELLNLFDCISCKHIVAHDAIIALFIFGLFPLLFPNILFLFDVLFFCDLKIWICRFPLIAYIIPPVGLDEVACRFR